MPPEEVLPANLLAVLAETGGSVLVAYDPALGFTEAGWLGFAIALGGRDGTLLSHMLGVREETRGTRDPGRGLGWSLKLIQGHEALRTGHTAAVWTFDPMRGANARLNLEKLGAGVDAFTVDKYGALRSDLYGPVPSDRLTARWDLVAPTTAARLEAVGEGTYLGMGLDDVAGIPEVRPECLPETAATRPPRLRYRIPDDVDRLMRDDPAAAIRWRREMRAVFSALLTTRSAAIGDGPSDDPLTLAVREEPGVYAITGFATGIDATGERASYYLLERTEGTR
jgi:chorismate synthase